MRETVPLAFALWPIVAMLLFRRLPAGRALSVTYIAGWLLLPNAWTPGGYPADLEAMTGSALQSVCFVTKGTVLGFSVLLAALLFARPTLGRLRLRLLDLPIAVWTVVPLLSGLSNELPATTILLNTSYNLLAWTVPWFLGRAFLGHPAGLLDFARIFRKFTLAYLPFAFAEFLLGPFWYEWIYGVHPYTHDGDVRYFLYRPLVLLEHGNELGLWVAMAAVTAFWLWQAERGPTAKSRSWLATVILTVSTILFQSVGGILLMLFGFALFPLGRLRSGRLALLLVMALAVLYVSVRALDLVQLRVLARDTAIGVRAKALLDSWGRKSLGWRLNLEEAHIHRAWEKPILGHGEDDWWQRDERRGRPWGLWILTFGQVGLTGLLAMTGTLLLPVLVLLRRKSPQQLRAPPWHGAGALAVLLTLAYADSLLNSTLPLVLIVVAGGLAAAAVRRTGESAGGPGSVWIRAKG